MYQYDTSFKGEYYELSFVMNYHLLIIMIIIFILSFVIIMWTIYHIDNIHVTHLGPNPLYKGIFCVHNSSLVITSPLVID